MAKDLGGFLKSFAGNLGGGLAGTTGLINPFGAAGLLLGGKGDESDPTTEDNPGNKMFGAGPGKPGGNSFLERFGGSLSDQLFKQAMMGFMGR